jgi:hypothetical protein
VCSSIHNCVACDMYRGGATGSSLLLRAAGDGVPAKNGPRTDSKEKWGCGWRCRGREKEENEGDGGLYSHLQVNNKESVMEWGC